MNIPGLQQIGGALSGLMGQKPQALAPAQGMQAARPTTDDAALLDLMESRYRYARSAKEPMLETWATALAFYCGEQWRKWEDKQKRLVKLTKVPSYRVLMVDNQIPGIVDTAAAKLARSRQIPRALPNTGEPDDRMSAQMGSRALEHWWHRDAMEQRELECNVMRILFGCGFYHDYWDPAIMAKIPVVEGHDVDQETGQIVPRTTAVRAPVGDVCVEVLSPFDVFPEPCEKYADIAWCIIARRRSLSWFKETFGEEGAKVEADKGEQDSVFNGLLPGVDEGRGASAPDGEGMATLKICYEKPSKSFPNGRHFMVAGKAILFKADELPLPHREIPVTIQCYRFVPKRLWPMGLVETLIGQQRELNRGQSNLAEIFRLYRSPKRYVERNWNLDKNAITSAPDEVVEGNFSGANPAAYVESPPNLPSWVSQYPDLQREAIRQLAGQHEVSQGGVPAGVTAASAIGLLQEADNVRLSAPARLGKEALERLSRHVLVTMVERYREERLISTFGRDREQQIYALMGADIGDRDVRVDLTEGVADTEAVRQQQLAEWMNAGLMDWVGSPLTIVMLPILRDVGLVWLAETIEEALPQLQQAQQAMMMQQAQMAALQGGEEQGEDPKLAAQDKQMNAKLEDAEAKRRHEAHQKRLDRGHQTRLAKLKAGDKR